MKRTFLFFVIASIILSSCADDGRRLLLKAVFPEVEITCDTTGKISPAGFSALEPGWMLSSVRLTNGSCALFTTPDGVAWYDVQTGTTLGRANSTNARRVFSSATRLYSNGDLACAASSAAVVAMNTSTGRLAWELNLPDCTLDGKSLTGIGSSFFVAGKIMDANGRHFETLYKGSLASSADFGEYITPKYSRQVYTHWCGYGRVAKLATWADSDNKEYLIVIFMEPTDEYKTLTFMGLYDIAHQKWVYERKQLNAQPSHYSVNDVAVANSGLSYILLLDEILALDILTGTIKASAKLPVGEYGAFVHGEKVWANQQLMLVKTSGQDIVAYDMATLSRRYRLRQAASPYTHTDFQLGLLVTSKYNECTVFDIHTGQLRMLVSPPCEGNQPARLNDAAVCWKNASGDTQLALTSDSNIYRYQLP
ncbi:MAG: hypothetical protein KIS77_06795 [Saprospiraceae bacterium]|nr:hypothetical protein [Saprospiraceae bacterium]